MSTAEGLLLIVVLELVFIIGVETVRSVSSILMNRKLREMIDVFKSLTKEKESKSSNYAIPEEDKDAVGDGSDFPC